MTVLRLAVLSLLVSASVLAVSASQLAYSDADFSAAVTVTLLPDLRPAERTPDRRAQAVLVRLKSRLTADMLGNFDLFLYVSKSDHGPLAQRMYVFRKQADGLKPAYAWAASTGREKPEVNALGRHVLTATPMGYFQLDPKRMYPRYHSVSWDQDMTSAMFFDWERAGRQTGLAIHAASNTDIAKLGSRASGGCIHLAPRDAATLFDLIQTRYRGAVPRFAYDGESRMGSNRGDFMRDRRGALKMADGYRVLVVLEDYGGEEDVAALF